MTTPTAKARGSLIARAKALPVSRLQFAISVIAVAVSLAGLAVTLVNSRLAAETRFTRIETTVNNARLPDVSDRLARIETDVKWIRSALEKGRKGH